MPMGETMQSENNTSCPLIDRFSLKERMIMKLGWYGFMAIGSYGIYKQSPVWAGVYVVCALLAFARVIMPGLCAHCPYPSRHDTCLFLPPSLLNRFYPYKGPQMSRAEKISVGVAMAGLVIMPTVWLITDLPLLILFGLFGLPTLAAFPVHYCKRCRHFDCPMNNAGGAKA
jgi:hypothetical protein